MIKDIMNQIEQLLQGANKMDPEKREQLLALTSKLQGEINLLTEKQDRLLEAAKKTVEHAKNNDEELNAPMKELGNSVEEFEAHHPKFTEIINSIISTLSNIGI